MFYFIFLFLIGRASCQCGRAQARPGPPTAPRLLHTENISHHYYHLFNSVKRRARISFWKLFSFASAYIKKKLQCLQGYSPAVFELYRGLWGAHLFLFFIKGGFCALAMGLQGYIKAMGGGGGVQLYIYVGPYEIRLNFSQILFYFF